jgi:hypothetical protein
MSDAQRRREPRVKSRGAVELRDSGGNIVQGKVYDISESGLSIQSQAALTPGQPVEVDCGGLVADAVVRHCLPVDGAYRIGLELLPSPPVGESPTA